MDLLWTDLSEMPTKYKISHPKAQFTSLLACDLSPIFQGQTGQIDQKMPIISLNWCQMIDPAPPGLWWGWGGGGGGGGVGVSGLEGGGR